MAFRLLTEFQSPFSGRPYLHRKSNQGDKVAAQLFEDLFTLGKSELLAERIAKHESVANLANKSHGIKARRGDGTFGELVPNGIVTAEAGFAVARGPVAYIEIGVEVKILAKAMIKQIDRVTSDLVGQVDHFKRGSGDEPICVGIVGINQSQHYTSFEGERAYKTDGKRYTHPQQEAAEAEKRLLELAKPAFDEFLIMPFRATNEAPFAFNWVNQNETLLDYSAILTRISRLYDSRFG